MVGALAVAVVLTGATVFGEYVSDETGWLPGFDIAIGAVSLLVSPLLLRRPVGATVLLVTLTALSPAATPSAAMGVLCVAQLSRFRVAAAVAAVGFIAQAVQGVWRGQAGIDYGWWLFLVAIAFGALLGWGRLARDRRALIHSLRERARRAEAEQGRRVAEARMRERHRVAREMHDGLAHRLSLLATYAGALEYRPDSPPEQLAGAAGVIRAGAHEALNELREVITVLREDAKDRDVLPQPVLDDIPRLIDESRDAGAAVELRDAATGGDAVPDIVGRTAYRIVQEGLTNARKHAAGQPVQVLLERQSGARLVIDIRNPLPPDRSAAPAAPGGGFGLIGMAERARLAGGNLDHGTSPPGEFRVRAWLPLPT
ncbi:Signal transduction histidine kinase [Glycomyces harbinensis]|uniref:histidine kinase n=1 Tax=Glycomyces harbinensis TaxID=58114 RepID=A0A1G6WY38_9ACTN|nr:Signal transduction histidine kinase [Glycomyces harbinensis]